MNINFNFGEIIDRYENSEYGYEEEVERFQCYINIEKDSQIIKCIDKTNNKNYNFKTLGKFGNWIRSLK